ncbi:lipoate protein ligase C-terminal domain-containing protein, partial [Staphylococcus haemolyticus]|uniref:lipoate protein ligase C-terminal domain-containing protein n=1 Tax=Staphylococcus haemolyticus TaxID=1283 RepID=UPI00374EDEDC
HSNYPPNPKYNFQPDQKFQKPFLQIKFHVKKPKIQHPTIFPHFFRQPHLTQLQNPLIPPLHHYTHIKQPIQHFHFYHYFPHIHKHTILKLISY